MQICAPSVQASCGAGRKDISLIYPRQTRSKLETLTFVQLMSMVSSFAVSYALSPELPHLNLSHRQSAGDELLNRFCSACVYQSSRLHAHRTTGQSTEVASINLSLSPRSLSTPRRFLCCPIFPTLLFDNSLPRSPH
jgi:hypothetical protein